MNLIVKQWKSKFTAVNLDLCGLEKSLLWKVAFSKFDFLENTGTAECILSQGKSFTWGLRSRFGYCTYNINIDEDIWIWVFDPYYGCLGFYLCNRLCKMTLPDRVIGNMLLFTTGLLFIYYTIWLFLLVRKVNWERLCITDYDYHLPPAICWESLPPHPWLFPFPRICNSCACINIDDIIGRNGYLRWVTIDKRIIQKEKAIIVRMRLGW